MPVLVIPSIMNNGHLCAQKNLWNIVSAIYFVYIALKYFYLLFYLISFNTHDNFSNNIFFVPEAVVYSEFVK